jgi:Protein of unknown function (DUF2971).
MTTRRLYKFYSPRWGIDALYRRRLKISTDRDINDPFEFFAAGNNRASRREAKNLRKRLFRDKGIISFCSGWQQPLLWSHYAENHSGIALGIDIPEQNCFDVKYAEERVKLPNQGNVYVFGQKLTFWNSIRVTKSSHWSYEAEVRVFPPIELSIQENGLYFWPLKDLGVLREVIIGSLYGSPKNLKRVFGILC